ncbi:hypothetical protein JTB14_022230 [Gonioctena quinquepunctata]|nr:hypothetical protein JTB14_022230 [Gonioctena quinquepunctata]
MDTPVMKHIFDLNGTFQVDKFQLTLGGVYPVKKIKLKSLYIFSAIFNHAISLTQLLLMLIFSLTQLSDLVKLSEALYFSSTQIAFISKLLNFNLRRKSMLELEDFLRLPSLTQVTDEEESIIREQIKGVRRIGVIFRVSCVGVVLFYGLFPLLDETSDGSKKLPLQLWFPFDSRKYYYELWFLEVLSVAIGAWINSNIDVLSYTLTTLATAQFGILKSRLRNVVKTTNYPEDDDIVFEELRGCVIHHNDIIRLARETKASFKSRIDLTGIQVADGTIFSTSSLDT